MTRMAGPSELVGRQVLARTFPPITRSTLAAYATASGDTNPIHLDPEVASAAGYPDVFAQGMLAMAYLGAALSDAIPPHAIWSYSVRFSAVTPLEAELTCTGNVAEIVGSGADANARLELRAVDRDGGVKLLGDAMVSLFALEENIG